MERIRLAGEKWNRNEVAVNILPSEWPLFTDPVADPGAFVALLDEPEEKP